jgi:hypothetical protein
MASSTAGLSRKLATPPPVAMAWLSGLSTPSEPIGVSKPDRRGPAREKDDGPGVTLVPRPLSAGVPAGEALAAAVALSAM